MSDNLPWKTWTPDDLAPPQAEFVPMVEPEETIIEEAEPSLEQQLAQLQMQAHEQGYQAGIYNQVNHLIPTRVLVKGGEITCKILK
jgi:flagellar assembly protein FliH